MSIDNSRSLTEILEEEQSVRAASLVFQKHRSVLAEALYNRMISSEILDTAILDVRTNPDHAADFSTDILLKALENLGASLHHIFSDLLYKEVDRILNEDLPVAQQKHIIHGDEDEFCVDNPVKRSGVSRYTINRNGIVASATYDAHNNTMIVHAGSFIAADFKGSDKSQKEAWDYIVASGLVDPPTESFPFRKLKRDMRCSSPAMAASLVKGNNSGRGAWRTESGAEFGAKERVLRSSKTFNNGKLVEFFTDDDSTASNPPRNRSLGLGKMLASPSIDALMSHAAPENGTIPISGKPVYKDRRQDFLPFSSIGRHSK